MLIIELFWSVATIVIVPLALQRRCRPRNLPGVRPRPSRRVTLMGARSDMNGSLVTGVGRFGWYVGGHLMDSAGPIKAGWSFVARRASEGMGASSADRHYPPSLARFGFR